MKPIQSLQSPIPSDAHYEMVNTLSLIIINFKSTITHPSSTKTDRLMRLRNAPDCILSTLEKEIPKMEAGLNNTISKAGLHLNTLIWFHPHSLFTWRLNLSNHISSPKPRKISFFFFFFLISDRRWGQALEWCELTNIWFLISHFTRTESLKI